MLENNLHIKPIFSLINVTQIVTYFTVPVTFGKESFSEHHEFSGALGTRVRVSVTFIFFRTYSFAVTTGLGVLKSTAPIVGVYDFCL